MSSADLLAQLEQVMTEFFAPTTSNERKHQIETQLNTVWTQPDAWTHVLYCIRHTSNNYSFMSCITALEVRDKEVCSTTNEFTFYSIQN